MFITPYNFVAHLGIYRRKKKQVVAGLLPIPYAYMPIHMHIARHEKEEVNGTGRRTTVQKVK